MTMQPWAKLAGLTVAGTLAATAIGASGAVVAAQDVEEGVRPRRTHVALVDQRVAFVTVARRRGKVRTVVQ